MRKTLKLIFLFILLCSHDLYIKLDTYFLQPNEEATLSLYNGTFENSENTITRDRMLDASFVVHGKKTAINPDQWYDKDSTVTQLTFKTGKAGTYVAGVSTKARNIELTAEKFNKYLKSDGVLDMLKQRTNDNFLDKDAVESYQKHVKAIYQVGDVKTNDWSTILGYPIEFVPQENPYGKHTGEKLEVQLLLDGKPLSNQLVFADFISNGHSHSDADNNNEHEHNDETHSHDGGEEEHTHESNQDKKQSHKHEHNGDTHSHDDNEHKHTHDSNQDKEHSHKHEDNSKADAHEHSHEDEEHNHAHSKEEEEHTHTNGQQLRTNDKGILTVDLPEDGIYYLRTIYMTRATDSNELTHRSKWATLTFEVTHSHSTDTHTHEDEHEHENNLPTWVFILGSLVFISVLFLIFKKQDK